ncbi:MAG: hypothetical protein HY909_17745 [Deltaproteobacteria bacterium]|nr:hypothetical protein [Deltaproteobacteria bacterium]
MNGRHAPGSLRWERVLVLALLAVLLLGVGVWLGLWLGLWGRVDSPAPGVIVSTRIVDVAPIHTVEARAEVPAAPRQQGDAVAPPLRGGNGSKVSPRTIPTQAPAAPRVPVAQAPAVLGPSEARPPPTEPAPGTPPEEPMTNSTRVLPPLPAAGGGP